MLLLPHGLSWLIAALAWMFLSSRLWRSFKRIGGKISKFFFYFSVFLVISQFSIGLSELFFADSFLILQGGLTASIFFNVLAFACFGYLITCIKFPNISPKLGFLVVFIFGMGAVILNLLFPFRPLYLSSEPGKMVPYTLHPLTGAWYLILIVAPSIPLGIILIRKALSSSSYEEKIKTLGLGVLCLLGVMVSFLYSIPSPGFVLIRRFSMIAWAVSVFLITLLTQKPPPSRYVKKI